MTFKNIPSVLLLLSCGTLLAGCTPEAGNEAQLTQRVVAVEQRLQILEAREAIRELFTAYGRTLDERDFVAFSELFTEDAVLVGGNGTAEGPQAIGRLMEDAILPNASGANLHVYTNEAIEVATDGTRASATSRGAFIVQDEAGSPVALIYATYTDSLRQEESVWKFQRREIGGDIPGGANEERFRVRTID